MNPKPSLLDSFARTYLITKILELSNLRAKLLHHFNCSCADKKIVYKYTLPCFPLLLLNFAFSLDCQFSIYRHSHRPNTGINFPDTTKFDSLCKDFVHRDNHLGQKFMENSVVAFNDENLFHLQFQVNSSNNRNKKKFLNIV